MDMLEKDTEGVVDVQDTEYTEYAEGAGDAGAGADDDADDEWADLAPEFFDVPSGYLRARDPRLARKQQQALNDATFGRMIDAYILHVLREAQTSHGVSKHHEDRIMDQLAAQDLVGECVSFKAMSFLLAAVEARLNMSASALVQVPSPASALASDPASASASTLAPCPAPALALAPAPALAPAAAAPAAAGSRASLSKKDLAIFLKAVFDDIHRTIQEGLEDDVSVEVPKGE